MNITDKTALVTGGASGLGEACVRMLIQKGARVAIIDMDKNKGVTLAKELGENTIYIRTDISDEASVKESVRMVSNQFGHIHFVINCAGIGGPMKVLGKNGPLSMDKFNHIMRVNVSGTMNIIGHAANKMVENAPNPDGEKGVIINTSSIAAFEGQIGQVAYTASKAAIVGITLPIAREFGNYGIRVMTIAPGVFDTPILSKLPEKVKTALENQVPFPKRLGYPEEFAALVCHIIENSYFSGETIRLDGGLRMSGR